MYLVQVSEITFKAYYRDGINLIFLGTFCLVDLELPNGWVMNG